MRPSSFDKLRMRSLGLPEKTHLMLSPSKHLVTARHLRSFLNFWGRFRARHCNGMVRPLGWRDSVLVAEREPESSDEEESGMSAAPVSQAYLPNTGSAYTQRYGDNRPRANAGGTAFI